MVTINIESSLYMAQQNLSIYFIVVLENNIFSLVNRWLTVVNRWLTVPYSMFLCLQIFTNVIGFFLYSNVIIRISFDLDTIT